MNTIHYEHDFLYQYRRYDSGNDLSSIAECTRSDSDEWIGIIHEIRDAMEYDDLSVEKKTFFVLGSVAARCVASAPAKVSTKEERLWVTLDQNLQALRWGRLQSYVKTWKGNDPMLYVRVNESVFAQRRNEKQSVCDPIRGALATWVAQYYGRKVTATTEPSCLANGAANCTFTFEFEPQSRLRRLIK